MVARWGTSPSTRLPAHHVAQCCPQCVRVVWLQQQTRAVHSLARSCVRACVRAWRAVCVRACIRLLNQDPKFGLGAHPGCSQLKIEASSSHARPDHIDHDMWSSTSHPELGCTSTWQHETSARAVGATMSPRCMPRTWRSLPHARRLTIQNIARRNCVHTHTRARARERRSFISKMTAAYERPNSRGGAPQTSKRPSSWPAVHAWNIKCRN